MLVPESEEALLRLLKNMNLAVDDGMLNLAGVLLFSEQPEWIAPQFVIKAIQYSGTKIHPSDYLDTEDFSGPLPKIFENALAFIMRNLHKLQAGRVVNMPGMPEIPEAVFEELLVNALVHRDYLVSAPIRLFIFDDRIEIISPGHLPNNLTVEKIRAGNSNIRNPILVSYAAKGLLPYHGLGSGIRRAVDFWPDEQTATGLIRRFNELEMQGKTVWIPAGNLPGSATRDLPEALRTMQAHPIVFQVYATQIRTLKADELSQLDQSQPKAIVFHSPSSADALFQSTAPELIAIREKAQLIAIGTVTQARLQEYSAKDIALCESADDAGVLDALNSLFKDARKLC